MSERMKLAAPGKNRSTRLRLSAKSLKCTVVLDASQLAGFEVPNGQPRVAFTIDVGGRAITGEFNSKSLRRVVTAIAEHGAEGVAVIAQGRLVGSAFEDAGIVAQPKTPKASEVPFNPLVVPRE
jgi:hypothetical protein